MARGLFINGETMVAVKGCSNSNIAALSQLGLSVDQIQVTPRFNRDDVKANAWGQAPFETQFMLLDLTVSMTLVQFDYGVLQTCIEESMGGLQAGVTQEGQMPRAGTLLGNAAPLQSATNHYISLNLYSPVAGNPWRFYACFLADTPYVFPLGTERSQVVLNWRCIPYSQDPWNNGDGAAGQILYDHILDS